MYKNLFFDLDGTLADTKPGIVYSLRYGLSRMGIEERDEAVLHAFIGPPLKEAFMAQYGMSEEAALETLAHYRVAYRSEGVFLCNLFEGVEALLTRLFAEGQRLFVATSKPDVFAKQILEKLGVAQLFTEIAGSLLDNTRTQKQEVIGYLLEKYPDTVCETLMIGDKHHDLIGAAACHIPAVGVLYGYGSFEELSGHPHVALAKDTEELYRIIRHS